MLAALGDVLFGVLSAIWDVIEAVLDFGRWRDDWDRTWSPVSYLLAVGAVLGLAFLVWQYGSVAWASLRTGLSPGTTNL